MCGYVSKEGHVCGYRSLYSAAGNRGDLRAAGVHVHTPETPMTSLRVRTVPDTDVQQSIRVDVPPVLRVGEREAFTLMTRSVLKDGSDEMPSSYASLVIPVTGPVAIDGVKVGDTLRVDVLDIEVASRCDHSDRSGECRA
jgi:hypothetical protein